MPTATADWLFRPKLVETGMIWELRPLNEESRPPSAVSRTTSGCVELAPTSPTATILPSGWTARAWRLDEVDDWVLGGMTNRPPVAKVGSSWPDGVSRMTDPSVKSFAKVPEGET